MPPIVVSVAVIRDGEVLLTKRDDFDVWCLPSGGAEWGESVAQAAVRETQEESGVRVRLDWLVGVYSRLGAIPDIHAVHFAATPLGGELRPQIGETTAVQYYPVNDLPEELVIGHRRRIQDAAVPAGLAKAVVQRFSDGTDGAISREELKALRDSSQMDASEFYLQFFSSRWTGPEEVEVGPS